MCPKLKSDDENFFKLDGIIEIKNDRNSKDIVELSQKLFGKCTTHQMDNEFDTKIVDDNSEFKTFYIGGFENNSF